MIFYYDSMKRKKWKGEDKSTNLEVTISTPLLLAMGAPPKAFQAATKLQAGMERKRKGGRSDL